MATVIDELIISLSLNTRQFNQQQQQAVQQLRQFQNQATTTANATQEATQNMVNGFQNVTREILGLGAAFLGVSGLKDLVVKTVGSADTLGKTASLLDVNTEALNRWINATRIAGGTTEGARGGLSNLITAFGRYKTNLSTPSELGMGALGALGPNVDWGKFFTSGDWEGFLKTLSSTISSNKAGFTPGVKNALAQEIPGVSELLLLLQKQDLGARLNEAQTLSQQQADAARKMEEAATRFAVAAEKVLNSWIFSPTLNAGNILEDIAKGDWTKLKTDISGYDPTGGGLGPAVGNLFGGDPNIPAYYGRPARWGRNAGKFIGPMQPDDTPIPDDSAYYGGDINPRVTPAWGRALRNGISGAGWTAPYARSLQYHRSDAASGFGHFGDVNNDNSRAIHIANLSLTPPGDAPHTWASTFISSVTAQASSGSR